MVEEQLIRLIASRLASFYFLVRCQSFPWRCNIFHFDIFYRRVVFSFYFQGDVMEEKGWGLLAIFGLFYLFVTKCQRKKLGKEKAGGSYVV